MHTWTAGMGPRLLGVPGMPQDLKQAYENLRKPHIQAALCERMDKFGLTEERLLRGLYEGLGATIVKVFNHGGKIITSKPFVDYPTRHKYLETALKLRSMFPAEKHEVTQRTVSDEEYRASLDRIERMLEKNRFKEIHSVKRR